MTEAFVARDQPQLTTECARAVRTVLDKVDHNPVFSRQPLEDWPLDESRDKLRSIGVKLGKPERDAIDEVTITAEFDFIDPVAIDHALFGDDDVFGCDLTAFEYRYKTVAERTGDGPPVEHEIIELEFTAKLTAIPGTETTERSVNMGDHD